MNIDTTFKLGHYFATIITYRNLSLVHPKTGEHPIFLGPVMIHTEKNEREFLYFAHSLEEYYQCNRKNLPASIRSIKIIITDDDSALRNAFRVIN